VIVAARDPGIAGNWVDPFGHVKGGMGLRLIKTENPPPVTSWLVPVAELERSGLACLTSDRAFPSGEVVE
jgi:hypothetical protein